MSTEDPRANWGDWTPGKGVERIRTEMPGVMPDLTDADYAAAEAVIAAAGGATVNSELTVQEPSLVGALSAWADSYWCKAADLPQRDRALYHAWSRLADDGRRQLTDLDAAYARGISEGQRLRAEEINTFTLNAYEDGRGDGLSEGRRRAAEAIRAADTSGWPGGRGSDVDGCQERAALIAEGGSHD